MLLDSDKLARIAGGVDRLSARFDAMVTKKDAAVMPSEYKELVKEKKEAQDALAALYKKVETSGYAGLNFRKAEYTRASNALAAAQAKMSKE